MKGIQVKGKWLKRVSAKAMALFPFIVIRPDVKVTERLLTHERIHLRQQLEMLIIPFYIWYLVEYLFKGYYGISFEREAYMHENDNTYLKKRRLFSWWKYL